jgi:phosphatidylserine/phosphatidylglycerophosphate/cardiolipin synthase-like enzyme
LYSSGAFETHLTRVGDGITLAHNTQNLFLNSLIGVFMVSRSFKTWVLMASFISSFSAIAVEAVQDAEEISIEGLNLNQENPLTPYALKRNGKSKKRFKVPYRALVDYYQFAGQGTIEENKNGIELMDLDMDVLTGVEADEVEFYIDMKRKKAYPLRLINPHSISELFVLKPEVYTKLADAEDFLSAKLKIYGQTEFSSKRLRYDRNFVHLEDWRSLNHPPVQDLGQDLTIWDKSYSPIDYTQHDSVFYKESFQKKIDQLSDSELTFGNKLELLANGESFARKMVEVKHAKKSVLMAVMSFFCDSSSRELEEILINKVKEGVDVKLMVEKVWTKLAMKKCMNRMIDGGVDVVYASDFRETNLKDNLFHNKFMIIDSEKVIMGGSNIVESDNISTGFNHMNRDNDVYIEGPIASDATLQFVELWKRYKSIKNEINQRKNPAIKDISVYERLARSNKAAELEKHQRGAENYAEVLNNPESRNNGVCRFIIQGPQGDDALLSKVFIEHMNVAENRLNMTTGSIYFDLPEHDEKERARDTWNKRFFRSVFAATERGVKLDIIGNGIDGGYGEVSNMINRLKMRSRFKFKPIHKTIMSIMTSWLDKGAAKKNQPYLEYIQKQPNARAWANFQYMHSKLIQIDRTVNMVSSYNLEEWSADKSHEMAVICMDKKLSGEMDQSFLRDFVNSVPAAITKK